MCECVFVILSPRLSLCSLVSTRVSLCPLMSVRTPLCFFVCSSVRTCAGTYVCLFVILSLIFPLYVCNIYVQSSIITVVKFYSLSITYKTGFTLTSISAIPHFKEVVIMATNCDACGHRSNEVKSGGK